MSVIIWGHTQDGCAQPRCSEREWKEVIARCAFRCFYCGVLLNAANLTKDHLVPLFRSGCECRGNLVASCLRCNSMKKHKTVYELLNVRPAFVQTTGKFYTTVSSLRPICDFDVDPLLKEVRRIAERHRFPEVSAYREPEAPSVNWRSLPRP